MDTITCQIFFFMYRILQINECLNGSTGKIARQIGDLAIDNGWDSYIAYSAWENEFPCKSKLIKIGSKYDRYFHALETRLRDNHGLASRRATKKFIEIVKELAPDIVHLHLIHGYYLNYPILFDYLSQADIPIVWTLHDCWAFTGHCAHYDFSGCQRWQTMCHDCPQKKEYPASLFFDRSAQNYAEKKYWFTSVRNMTLVPVSEWLAKEVKKSFLGQYPVHVIYNGIDINVFKPCPVDKKSFGLAGKFVVLGVASVWSQRKGLADFIKLRGMLSDDYVIVLIGLNKKQITSLPEGVVGISNTNNVQELAEYYSMADVYINASVEETLGMTSIESLSCGTPVIVYNATACPETVSSKCGFVVAPHDIEYIVKVITQIKKQGKIAYKESCRKRAVTCFNKMERFEEYLILYDSLKTKIIE